LSLVSRTELLFLCRRFLATSAMLLVSASPVSANTDSGEFPLRNLDELIAESEPERRLAAVELKMFDRISVVGEAGSLPRPRKTTYLMQILARWGVNPLPEVHQEMVVVAPSGNTARLYLEAGVAKNMVDSGVAVGDTLRLSGYHVYNSKHGPGVLVAGYERIERSWIEQLKDWFGDSASETTP